MREGQLKTAKHAVCFFTPSGVVTKVHLNDINKLLTQTNIFTKTFVQI